MNNDIKHNQYSDIAVIGCSGVFPLSNNIDEFWRNICSGKDLITTFSEQELISSGVSTTLINNEHYIRRKGIILNVGDFDAGFFNMSPRESEFLDPQHRLFLEQIWYSLEDSFCNLDNLDSSRVGVFGSTSVGTYLYNLLQHKESLDMMSTFQLYGMNDKDALATRASYKLNLKGPSITVQTACSSSLVALHLACQSLRNNDCDVAIVGAVSVTFPHVNGYLFEEGGILSRDGMCRPFDKNATGTVDGEGCGVVVLRRLEDAIKNNDRIRAIIKGTAVNNDGSQKVSFSAPSIEGQYQVIISAIKNSGVDPSTIGYVEAHGTATKLGDPIEFQALCRAFNHFTDRQNFCTLGSVKANIGHLDVASGIVGLIKVICMLENRKKPGQINFKTPNPLIQFENSPFYINESTEEWTENIFPRRASVSSFGIGGTNAHVILEEYNTSNQIIKLNKNFQILPLSAKTEKQLLSYETELLPLVNKASTPEEVEDICYSQAVGRKKFPYKKIYLLSKSSEGQGHIKYELHNLREKQIDERGSREIVFLLGNTHYDRATFLDTYQNNKDFKNVFDNSCKDIKDHLNISILNTLSIDKKIHEYHFLITFIIEYSLSKVLMKYGVLPDAIIGYNTGEILAGCLAGVFSFIDAIKILMIKNELMLLNKELDQELENDLRNIQLYSPNLPFVSNISGDWVSKDLAVDSRYWRSILLSHQNFNAAVGNGYRTYPNCVFLNVGLSNELLHYTKKCLDYEKVTLTCNFISLFDSEVLDCFNSREVLIFHAISKLWLFGAKVDWCKFYEGEQKKKVFLPSYAFEKKKFLIDNKTSEIFVKKDSNKRSILDWIYVPTWRLDINVFEKPIKSILYKQKVLLFGHITPLFETFINELHSLDVDVINMHLDFSTVTDVMQNNVINPFNIPSWESAFLNLKKHNILPDQLILFTPQMNSENWWEVYESFLAMIREINKLYMDSNIEVLVITSQMVKVLKTDIVNPFQSLMVGPCRVIPKEYKNISCRIIDLSEKENINDRVAFLIEEMYSHRLDPIVAYRNNNIWLPVYEKAERALLNKTILPSSPLKDRGVYIITGGTGGIGQVIAKYLARHFNAIIVLTTRKSISSQMLTGKDLLIDKEISNCFNSYAEECELKLLNNIFIVQADIGKYNDVDFLIQATLEKFGKINGIFHAAGIAGGRLLDYKNSPDTGDVFIPKVNGINNLIKAIENINIDFVVLFSSLSALLGEIGQVDYCSANAYLDAIAEKFLNLKTKIVSINWCAWKEVGMAYREAVNKQDSLSQKLGVSSSLEDLETAISNEEGMKALQNIISSSFNRYIVSSGNFHDILDANYKIDIASIIKNIQHIDYNLSEAPIKKIIGNQKLRDEVIRVWKNVLGLQEINLTDSFFQLGGDSLLALSLISQLSSATGKKFSINDLFQYPTLISFLESQGISEEN